MQKKELFVKCYNKYKTAEWYSGGYKGKVNYAIQKEEDKIFILFQCSKGLFDWVCDLLFFPRKIVPYKNMPYEFKVHLGFWKYQFNPIRDDVFEKVKDIMTKNEINEIVIYGWSLGGRLASFCKEMLSFHFPSFNISCITIGAPRGFCKTDNWEQIKKRFDNTTRYQNGSDLVTVVPFKFLGLFTPFTHEVEKTHVGDKFSWLKIFKTGTYHLDSEYYKSIMGEE